MKDDENQFFLNVITKLKCELDEKSFELKGLTAKFLFKA